MADTEQVMGIDNTVSLVEQLGKACLDLEAHKNNSHNNKVSWTEIKNHFYNLETILKNKTEELEAKEREFEAKESKTRTMLEDRESAVSNKERDLIHRVQDLKDAAVAHIAEAREKYQPIPLDPVDIDSKNKVNAIFSALDEQSSPHHITTEMVKPPRPELMKLCEQMDANGLVNFCMENKNIIPDIRDELSVALLSAAEPPRLVLDSLEGFFPLDESSVVDLNDDAFNGMRQSCITIMEAMAILLARPNSDATDHLLNHEIKRIAKVIADEWKSKLAKNINLLEAGAFLQLVATFKIASEFDEEELCNLLLAIAGNKQTSKLCHSLGLTRKIPGIVEALINTGKQIEAVHFSEAFKLTETFPSAALLKSYLRELRRNAQGKGGVVEGGQSELNAQEFTAVKAVMECIKKYKLEADYPLEPLERRAAQLGKPKSDRKRSGEDRNRSGESDRLHNQQSKRSRPNGGGSSGFRGRVGPAYGDRVPLSYKDRMPNVALSDSYPHTASNAYNYQVPSQTMYPQQTIDQRSYYYPQADRVAPTSYNTVPPSDASAYGSYVGGGSQPSHQAYM